MVHQRTPLRGLAATIVALAVAGLLTVGQEPAYTDDIDLLRFTTAKPYVFFLIDNSASMNLAPDGKWVHANGDDPRSKIYQVKRVLYEIFKDVNDIQFGFAAFNQDNARVTSKHWLYYYVSSASNKLPNGWPITYPAADNDGPVVIATNGTATGDVEGDLMTFGAHLGGAATAGTCNVPLPFGNVAADDRERINRFSKLGANGNGPTKLWIEGGAGNKTYLLTVERPPKKPDLTDNPEIGKDDMDVRLTLQEVKSNGCITDQSADFQTTWTGTLTLSLWKEFLLYDENNGRTAPDATHSGGIDKVAGFWDAKDIQDLASCGSSHPFSGSGWEGNYDSASPASPIDPFCANPSDPSTCINLKLPTVTDPDFGPTLDKGDVLPFDWRAEQKADFLRRLAPNHGSGSPDFGISSYFGNSPDPSTGMLPLENAGRRPFFASGPSPLGKSVIDFRCWYMGSDANKCKSIAYPKGGWEAVAGKYDSEWGCRKPYLIVVSDGGDSCGGENPCADTANLQNTAGAQTWVIAYGADCANAKNPLKCMPKNDSDAGKLPICPQDSDDLKKALEEILGLIRQEARAFASAAVPSVQAVVDDKIFLTNFIPLNSEAVWDGHVHAFYKPLPLTNGKPNTEHENHLWDAGEVMYSSQLNPADPTGAEAEKRRVYYAFANTANDKVPATKRFFEKTENATPKGIRYDLWNGLGISFQEDDESKSPVVVDTTAQADANKVIADTFNYKEAKIEVKNPDGTTSEKILRYVLGDIFHSNPLVVGNPPNIQYFSSNLNEYVEFAEKHKLRRKMLLVGANDGMLHAFDAGQYNDTTDFFSRGTGKEVFGYIPRAVLPTVRLISEPTATNHQWGVDGTVSVADVHIDPEHDGTPDEDQREWRSVAVGGLREGGSIYYAVDITQPDVLTPGTDPVKEPFVPRPAAGGYVPSCTEEGTYSESECGPVPFPSVMWEFDDSVLTLDDGRVLLDEEDKDTNGIPDGNGKPDLGETWSTPNVGRIRVAVSAGSEETRDIYVAVFGGGLDPANKSNPQQGTWIYMVDIETGKAIYKRQLKGAVPSEPAAVDTDGDAYLDRIYIGTTAGLLYRIDLTADIVTGPDPDDRLFPALMPEMVRRIDNKPHLVQRVPKTSWAPHVIFNASTDLGVPTLVDRPIFFRPSVVYDGKVGAYLVAFGTGDRDDLWNNDAQTGRFVMFVDDTDSLPKEANGDLKTVLNETSFVRVNVSDPAWGGNIENQTAGRRGWYLVLDANERVINDAFALTGVTFFSTFKPRVDVTNTKTEGPRCSKTGFSRVFIVSTLNADPFVPSETATDPPKRHFEVPNFVTNPFAEQRQTKNEDKDVAEICDDESKDRIMNSLKSLFPPDCKFGNYMVDIKTIAADTSLVCIAPIPVCLVQRNWKEY